MLTGRAIEERIVPVGASVTLLGRWSEAKGGFAPAGTSINRLFPATWPASGETSQEIPSPRSGPG